MKISFPLALLSVVLSATPAAAGHIRAVEVLDEDPVAKCESPCGRDDDRVQICRPKLDGDGNLKKMKNKCATMNQAAKLFEKFPTYTTCGPCADVPKEAPVCFENPCGKDGKGKVSVCKVSKEEGEPDKTLCLKQKAAKKRLEKHADDFCGPCPVDDEEESDAGVVDNEDSEEDKDSEEEEETSEEEEPSEEEEVEEEEEVSTEEKDEQEEVSAEEDKEDEQEEVSEEDNEDEQEEEVSEEDNEDEQQEEEVSEEDNEDEHEEEVSDEEVVDGQA